VSNLPFKTSWQDLKDYFRAAGNGARLSRSSSEQCYHPLTPPLPTCCHVTLRYLRQSSFWLSYVC